MKIIKKPVNEDPVSIYNKMILQEQAKYCPFCKNNRITYEVQKLWERENQQGYYKERRICKKTFKSMIDNYDDLNCLLLKCTCTNPSCNAEWETDYLYLQSGSKLKKELYEKSIWGGWNEK